MERKMTCPKCGAENLVWRSRCKQCGEELHKEELHENENIVKIHRWSVLEWFMLISGLTGAGITALLMLLIFAMAEGHITPPIGWLFVLLPPCSIAIALKWRLVGGVLLILESLALFIWMGMAIWVDIQSGSPFWLLLIPLIPGVLLLTSGVLFLISWRKKQKHGES